jgi:hypothetical protein
MNKFALIIFLHKTVDLTYEVIVIGGWWVKSIYKLISNHLPTVLLDVQDD